jgi:hypothetical protein
MSHKYRVQPIPTINIPEMHPGVIYRNYELYISEGEIVDVRTRHYAGCPPEIVLVQVIGTGGTVVRRLTPDDVELPEDVLP